MSGSLNVLRSRGNVYNHPSMVKGQSFIPYSEVNMLRGGIYKCRSGKKVKTEEAEASRNKTPFVIKWLKKNYEPYDGVSTPRFLLYTHYLEYCKTMGAEVVNSASFGKIIRSVFPTLRTRRLGTRGHSKYHYYGIRHKRGDLKGAEDEEARKANYISFFSGSKSIGSFGASSSSVIAFEDFLPTEVPKLDDMKTDTDIEALLNECLTIYPFRVPTNVDIVALEKFSSYYREHCLNVFLFVVNEDSKMVGMEMQRFSGILCREEFGHTMECEELERVVASAEGILYRSIRNHITKQMLDVSGQNVGLFHSILTIEQSVGDLGPFISGYRNPWVQLVVGVLRRRESIIRLLQCVQNIFSNRKYVQLMAEEWASVDFISIAHQWAWIALECHIDNIVYTVRDTIGGNLAHGVPIEAWTVWMNNIVELCVKNEQNYATFLLNQSFLSSIIIKDLSLKGCQTFGAFHVLKLLFEEYSLYLIENKLEDGKCTAQESTAFSDNLNAKLHLKKRLRTDSSLITILNQL